jgi:hypothetical protein
VKSVCAAYRCGRPPAPFLNGGIAGQIRAIHRDREERPDRVADFKAAIEAGDVSLGHVPLTKSLTQKLSDLGIAVPR